jgi:D-alanyl-D-alanine dipeptidase
MAALLACDIVRHNIGMPEPIPIEVVSGGHPDFTRLADIAGIRHELRYASTDNFVGADMYSPFDCAWLHREGAEALRRSAGRLAERHPGITLLVLDALRPQRVQERMWKALEGTGLTDYLANPAVGSIHSFGMAVDVTLCDAEGKALDMGTPFDDLTEKSHPVLEAALLARGALTPAQVANREILRDAMAAGGWRGISREWWHFDAGDRVRIRSEMPRVM